VQAETRFPNFPVSPVPYPWPPPPPPPSLPSWPLLFAVPFLSPSFSLSLRRECNEDEGWRKDRRDAAGQTRIRKRREKEVEASKWTGYSLSPCSLPHLFRTVDERSIITWSASLSPSRCSAFLSLRCCPHLLSLCLFSLSLLLSLSLSLLLSHSFFSPQATLASCTLPSYPPRSITTRCRDTRAPLLASKTVLDPRATLHTIRERHGEAPLLSDSPSCSARGHHWRHKAHCSTASVVTKRGLSWFHSGSRLIITKRFCSQEIDEFSGTRQRLLFISSQNNW